MWPFEIVFNKPFSQSPVKEYRIIGHIAKYLERDHRVVAREIYRNSGEVLPYTAVSAQRIATRHEQERTKKKLERDEDLKNHIINELRKDISPKQIAGTLAKYPPAHLNGKTICHETIYQYIYTGDEYLYHNLRKGRPKRRKQRARKPRKITILERISIHQRPKEITLKKRFGHWESDMVLCKNRSKCFLSSMRRNHSLFGCTGSLISHLGQRNRHFGILLPRFLNIYFVQ